MKKPKFVPGDVILEVKSNAHLHKIILRKDTLEIIMGPNSFIFDLDKIQSIKSDKGSDGLFTAKPAEIRIVGQSRGDDRTDIWRVSFPHNQNDEINKLVDTFYEKRLTWEKQQQINRAKESEKVLADRAKECEKALDYNSAIEIWEKLGEIEEAARVREIEKEILRKKLRQKAYERERALDYDSAIEIWEELGEIEEAARVRKLKAEQSAVKVDQTVVHGDYVDDRDTTYVDDRDTIIQDSVVSKSNVGAGGKSKGEQIKVIKDLLDSGAIDDDEFKQMKKEILGK